MIMWDSMSLKEEVIQVFVMFKVHMAESNLYLKAKNFLAGAHGHDM